MSQQAVLISVMLCQFNVSIMKFPARDPRMSAFHAAIDPVNALAEAHPGFLWRHLDDGADPDAVAFLGPNHLANLSAWQSLDLLMAFVHHPAHRAIMIRRDEWFLHGGEALAVLWTQADETSWPTMAEGITRLRQLRSHGPSERAFHFAWARQQGLLQRDPGFSVWD